MHDLFLGAEHEVISPSIVEGLVHDNDPADSRVQVYFTRAQLRAKMMTYRRLGRGLSVGCRSQQAVERGRLGERL